MGNKYCNRGESRKLVTYKEAAIIHLKRNWLVCLKGHRFESSSGINGPSVKGFFWRKKQKPVRLLLTQVFFVWKEEKLIFSDLSILIETKFMTAATTTEKAATSAPPAKNNNSSSNSNDNNNKKVFKEREIVSESSKPDCLSNQSEIVFFFSFMTHSIDPLGLW